MKHSEGADLSGSAIFKGVAREAVVELCTEGQLLSLEAGRVLFERGEDAKELMILREGVVELIFPVQIMGATREVTIETKQAGDVVAWSALVHPYRFTAGARCAGACVLTTFHRDVLEEFFENDPRSGYLIMRNLAGVIGRRFQMMQTTWLHDLQASAVRRLG